MVLLALSFSLQHQVEKYGSYVGIASFFGLAALSLLYFAQARELKRLRDWAGRAPERAQELEERVVAQAEAVRRVPAPVQPRRDVLQPATAAGAAPATNGARKLKPEEIAALAFARAAGVPQPPHPPAPAPAPVAQPVAVAAEEAPAEEAVGTATAVVDAPAPDEQIEVPATGNGNGHGNERDVPAPATPAARRPGPAAAPLRATPPPRRPAPAPARRAPVGPPPRRETSTRSLVITIGLGVIVLAVAVFGVLHFTGGGSSNKPVSENQVPVVSAGGGSSTAKGGKARRKPTPAPTTFRPTTTVAVLNGTVEGGLAANTADKLSTAGYANGNITPTNNTTRGIQKSYVRYKTGDKAQGQDIAKVLDIKDVRPMDAATAASGGGKDVVVVVGEDQFK